MRHFEIVPRSLGRDPRLNGPKGGPPNVRYAPTQRLAFSKRAAEIFQPHPMVIVGYDRHARELCFTAVDKPPEGYTECACYPINWIKTKKKHEPSNCTLACKSLFQKIGFHSEACLDFPVLSVEPESHSIIVAIPDVAAGTDPETVEAARAGSRPNGEDHAAV